MSTDRMRTRLTNLLFPLFSSHFSLYNCISACSTLARAENERIQSGSYPHVLLLSSGVFQRANAEERVQVNGVSFGGYPCDQPQETQTVKGETNK
jgi:hypothetical protein